MWMVTARERDGFYKIGLHVADRKREWTNES